MRRHVSVELLFFDVAVVVICISSLMDSCGNPVLLIEVKVQG